MRLKKFLSSLLLGVLILAVLAGCGGMYPLCGPRA
jgi:hypothetical protein